MSELLAQVMSMTGGREPGVDEDLSTQLDEEKLLSAGVSVLMIGAVLWPVVQNWREQQRDSFPLSYYPMFTLKRSATVRVTYLLGMDPAGGRHQIPYTYAGTGGLNQVRRQINRLVREGRSEALCDSVARRIVRQETGSLSQVVEVRLVTGKYRLADYFAGETYPVSERVLASSEVNRNVS